MMLEERNDAVIIKGSEEELRKIKENPALKKGDGICVVKEDLKEAIPDAPKVLRAEVPDDAYYKEKINSQAKEILSLNDELSSCHKKIASMDQELIEKKLRIHKLESALIEATIR